MTTTEHTTEQIKITKKNWFTQVSEPHERQSKTKVISTIANDFIAEHRQQQERKKKLNFDSCFFSFAEVWETHDGDERGSNTRTTWRRDEIVEHRKSSLVRDDIYTRRWLWWGHTSNLLAMVELALHLLTLFRYFLRHFGGFLIFFW